MESHTVASCVWLLTEHHVLRSIHVVAGARTRSFHGRMPLPRVHDTFCLPCNSGWPPGRVHSWRLRPVMLWTFLYEIPRGHVLVSWVYSRGATVSRINCAQPSAAPGCSHSTCSILSLQRLSIPGRRASCPSCGGRGCRLSAWTIPVGWEGGEPVSGCTGPRL